MIKEYCFYINDIKFSDKDFNSVFISFLKTTSESLQSLLNDYQLDLENDLPKSAHEIILFIEKVPILRVRIFRQENLINQHTEIINQSAFFGTIGSLLMNTVSQYVNLLDEAKNASKQ